MTTPLGLILLKTTSEELACPREDLSVARKEELRKLLLDQVQTVLGLLTGECVRALVVPGDRSAAGVQSSGLLGITDSKCGKNLILVS